MAQPDSAQSDGEFVTTTPTTLKLTQALMEAVRLHGDKIGTAVHVYENGRHTARIMTDRQIVHLVLRAAGRTP